MPGHAAPVLEVRDLVRVFRAGRTEVSVLRGIDLTVTEGETVGLLGVNGAGKTTLLKIISSLLLATSGTVRVCGFDVVTQTRKARGQLSVVLGGDRGFYSRLSAEDNIRYFATLSGLSRHEARVRSAHALEGVGLAEVAGRRVETFSKGMRQRLHLACGLLTDARLLLLDEPTVGLDPIEAARLRESIGALQRSGVSIVLTSHYLGDIERLASRVAVLREGRIEHDLGVDELIKRSGVVALVRVTVRAPHGDPPPLTARDGIRMVSAGAEPEGLWSFTAEVADWSPSSLRALADLWPGGDVLDVQVRPVGLERVFAELAGRRSDVA